MTDGERQIVQEQERDARECEEGGDWVACPACGGSGYHDTGRDTDRTSLPATLCRSCLGLGSWRVF